MVLNNCKRVKIDFATKPAGGLHFVYVGCWWVVTPEEEILFYHGHAPQCNSNQKIAESICNRLYPGLEVRQIPCVFVEHQE